MYVMKAKLLLLIITIIVSGFRLSAQQNIYSRDNSGTDLWWNDTNKPWYYQTWNSTEVRPDIWPLGTRNYVFIGHNANTIMKVNGAYFPMQSLTIQASASNARVYNAIDNGGMGLTLGIFNNSSALQTFNVPIRVDAENMQLSAVSGPMIFNNPIYTEGRSLEFTDANNITVNGVIQQGGAVTKKGSGTVTYKAMNTYTGVTTVEGGTLVFEAAGGAIPAANNVTVKNSGTLRISKDQTLNNLSAENTAAIIVDAGISLTINGTLTLSAPNSITLGAGASLRYGGSGALVYNTAGTITVSTTEWPVTNGPSSVTVISGTVTLAADRTLTGNLSVHGGTLDLSLYTLNRVTSGGMLLVANGAALKIGGTNTLPTNYATVATGATSTTEYYGEAQVVSLLPSSSKYGHLTLSGSGVKTLDGNVTTAGNLTVNAVALNVTSGQNLTVEGNLVNNGGTVAFANNANLLQSMATTINANSGSVIINRDSSPIYRNDFTMWSSPVAGQKLFGFSPNTLPNRFYVYNTASNQYNAVPDLGPESSTTFDAGKGYLIRMPNAGMVDGILTGATASANGYNAGTTVMTFNGKFTGVPNNGTITVPLSTASTGYNFVGNPYPSPINIAAFQAANTNAISGSIWIWRKKSQPASENSAYITINSAGIYTGNGQPEQEDPNGVLRTGQGFIVQLKSGYTTNNLVFTNAMRSGNTANQFFRQVQDDTAYTMPEAHGIWLNLTNTSGAYSQMYTGYIDGATNGEDDGLDAKYIGDSPTVLAALINNNEYTIQAKALPFNQQDVVPLAMKAAAAGTYTITIDHTDGLFAEGQEVYLHDNFTNQLHNLGQGGYNFTTEAGTFNSRFAIVYNVDSVLETASNSDADGSIMVYKDTGILKVKSGISEIRSLVIYDVQGRELYNKSAVNKCDLSINCINPQQQMLLFRIATEKAVTFKRIVY
jgi:autotransporter-associated beta strand protein